MRNPQELTHKPIDTTIKALQRIEKITESLNPHLFSVTERISHIESIVNNVYTLTHNVDSCCKAISILEKLTQALTPIPIIGEIILPISRIIGTAGEFAKAMHNTLKSLDNALKKLRQLLQKVHGGVDELAQCNKMIHDHIPEFIKTIRIIEYLIQLAEIAAPILMGDDINKRLNELIDHLKKIENAASIPINELDKLLNEIDNVTNAIEEECNKIKGNTKELASGIEKIGNVIKIIEPIARVLNTIIDAIAPIKWVLNAIGCLIDKILKPIINAILEVTGLNRLLDFFKENLMKYLGITAIIDAVKKHLTPEDFLKKLEKLSASFQEISSGWNVLSASLEDFSPMKKIDMEKKITELLFSVLNGIADPTKPAPIPIWPDEPELAINYKSKIDIPRFQKIDWTFYDPSIVFEPKTSILRLEKYTHPEAKKLEDRVVQTNMIVCGIHPMLKTLTARLDLFAHTAILPGYFNSEIEMLKIYLVFVDDLVSFLSQLPHIPKSIQEILFSIHTFVIEQLNDCSTISGEINTLHCCINEVEQQLNNTLKTIPEEEELSAVLQRIQAWPISLEHLLDGFKLAKHHKPTENQLKELKGINNGLKKDAKDLYLILDAIDKSSKGVISSLKNLDNETNKNIKALEHLSPEGYLLPQKYMTSMSEIARILQQLDTIFEPLLLLLEVLQKKEAHGDNSIPDLFRMQIVLFSEKMKKQVDKSVFIEILESLLKSLSPISLLCKKMKEINNQLQSSAQEVLLSESKILIVQIKELVQILNEGKTYEFKDEETLEIITNRYFSQEEVEKAKALAKEIIN
ncbi:hypothetical protein D0T50_02620 [Bacteroides sp. 214]|uniref:hypothetical protein n=1 Tax=Bacteroides sp. 214 TaxID=2302935 RepID=UPI0013D6F2C0|nr:hypothetical protein [Bacteroides sp. 214]NDW11781.1 hypothetical protein [Bacteroides sp. 214]